MSGWLWTVGNHCSSAQAPDKLSNTSALQKVQPATIPIFYTPVLLKVGSEPLGGVLDFPFPNIFFYLAQHYILLRRTEFSFLLLQTVTPSLESSLSCAQLELKVTFFPSQTPTSASLVLTRLRLVQRPHFSVLKSTYSRHPLSYKHHTFLSTQI